MGLRSRRASRSERGRGKEGEGRRMRSLDRGMRYRVKVGRARECERQTAWNETAKKEAARFFSWKHRGARQSERAGEAESRDYFGIGQR